MDWDLDGPPMTVRAALAGVAAVAVAAATAWGVTAAADARPVVAAVAIASLAAAWPLLRAAGARPRRDRLRRDADGRWAIDSAGAVGAPTVALDGGAWLLLVLRSPVAGDAGRTHWAWATRGADDSRWAALRRAVFADAATAAEAGR